MASLTNAAVDTVVNPPALVAPRVSLLTSANVIDGDETSRWEGGYGYAPEGCGDATVALICPSTPEARAATDNASIVTFQPFSIWAADKCSTWSIRERDFYGRALRKLLAAESWYLENELMRDTLSLDNYPVLSNTTSTVTSGGVTPTKGLAAIEDGLASCSKGGRFMIHVRPGILTQLVADSTVRREGNVWLTATDNIVVPGRGYPGTGPSGQAVGATEWIYATSMVTVLRSKISYTPSPEPEATQNNPQRIPKSAVARSTNDVFVMVERTVSVAYDPTCCVLAAQITR